MRFGTDLGRDSNTSFDISPPLNTEIKIKPPKSMDLSEAEDLFKKLENQLDGIDQSSNNDIISTSPNDLPDVTYAAENTEENIKKQDAEIKKVESGEVPLETTQEKGNYGEMKLDQDMREKGYERISTDMVTDLHDSGHQGIDGVYYNPNGTPKYIIADAKYGTAQLSETQDGKQMSENWIDKRLDEAVGKEKADEIRMEKLMDPDNVGSYVSHIDENGNTSYDKLDSDGNVVEKDVKINE